MDTFAPVLLRISESLSAENVDAIKFLCSDYIGKKKLEKITSGIQLFLCLKELQKIEADNTEFLRYLLTHIDRADLLGILDNFEKHTAEPQDELPDANEQEKLDVATEVITEYLGRNWRMYGRKLGITDAKLDHIREKYPFNLQEQVVELLRDWRKMRKAEAKVEDLINALQRCNMNLTADLVKQALSQRIK